jgi:hypothetical protein
MDNDGLIQIKASLVADTDEFILSFFQNAHEIPHGQELWLATA